MMRGKSGLVLCAYVAFWANDANACRVPRQPVEPLSGGFSASAIAVVTSTEKESSHFTISEILYGEISFEAGQLSYLSFPGDCGPAGPRVSTGDQIVLYLHGNRFGRWALLSEVAPRDPFVEASAVAGADTEARRVLMDRAALVTQFRGPVPETDPNQWLGVIEGSLRGTASRKPITRVRFRVNDDGFIEECRIFIPRKPLDRDRGVCETLRSQARFKAPMLSQEREGIFEARWES